MMYDFIEQAERLAEAGYYPTAASLGGADPRGPAG